MISPQFLFPESAQFQFVHIHPFVDGNGRTARLFVHLILYKTGYDFKRLFSISEFYDKDRPSYYDAIQSVRKNNMNMTGWLEYFANGLRSQMKEIQEKAKKVIISENIMKDLAAFHLNGRQGRIVRFLFLNERIDNEQCQVLCKSIKRTATRDLTSLVEKSILQKHGEKKGTYYILAPDIKNRIRDIKGHA